MKKAQQNLKCLSIGLHCRLVGRPGRAMALARLPLDYDSNMRFKEQVWVTEAH